MILLFTAIILYLLYLFLEHRQNEAARRSFLHVIHVNGIRGKTGTCRTLDAVLRAKYKSGASVPPLSASRSAYSGGLTARGPIFW